MASDTKRLIDAAKNPSLALDYELAQEMATALGRLGRALEAALQALADFDTANAENTASPPESRRALVAKAGNALWQFIVQRESCGLRDTRQIMREYRVPAYVQHRMGVFAPELAQTNRPRP